MARLLASENLNACRVYEDYWSIMWDAQVEDKHETYETNPNERGDRNGNHVCQYKHVSSQHHPTNSYAPNRFPWGSKKFIKYPDSPCLVFGRHVLPPNSRTFFSV
jgi:hypothetical protein